MTGWYKKRWIKRLAAGIVVATVVALAWYFVRIELRPSIPGPSDRALTHAKQVKILRDDLGVPHIFGKTDADTAFGLAYANAEDDFPMIQGSLAAARGKLALLLPKKIGVINDYMVQFLMLPQKLDDQYDRLISKDYKPVLEAYAEGLNYYAALHPDEVDSRLLPYTGKDIVAGFIHKLTLFVGVDSTLKELMSRDMDSLKVGQTLQRIRAGRSSTLFGVPEEMIGSNAHAVGPGRSADGITRLNINSHQPWEGPVTWYEAHLVSEEGWNMIGGIFPGAPIILHGHNQFLGWAHTVNKPDAVDVYKLTMHPDGSMKYKFDGAWRDLAVRKARIKLDVGLFNLPITRDIYESVHGPVLKLDAGYFAIRYAGKDRTGLSVEQWYRMNRSKNMTEFKAAMALQGLPMMNTMYADKKNILYIYNHLLPIRNENFDWLTILPGDTSEALWNDYLPFDQLPMVENPPSGYIINTNSTPFQATLGEGNPDPEDYSKTFGIETIMNNRAIRSHELFGADTSITREAFFAYKFDQTYSRKSELFLKIIAPLLSNFQPDNKKEEDALAVLRRWDGVADADSTGAALANLIYDHVWTTTQRNPLYYPEESKTGFKNAVAFLSEHYGRVDVPLGQIQRLERGKTDLPMGGGKDTLNAVHTKTRDNHLVGVAGDSYILIVEFSDQGAESWARHQYGNVNREDSVHYDDQALAFTRHHLRKSLLTMDAVREKLESEYHPGSERP